MQWSTSKCAKQDCETEFYVGINGSRYCLRRAQFMTRQTKVWARPIRGTTLWACQEDHKYDTEWYGTWHGRVVEFRREEVMVMVIACFTLLHPQSETLLVKAW